MPRFNPNKYDPASDSTEGEALDGKLVLLTQMGSVDGVTQESCLCGCGHFPHNPKSRYMMGHDARLRGKLIRAHLTDTPVLRIRETGSTQIKRSKLQLPAMELATELGWAQYLTDAELRRDGKNRQVLAKAVGSKRTIKVGRWKYTGQVAAVYSTPTGEEVEVEYVTKTGEVKRKRVSVKDAPMASSQGA